MGLEAQSQQDEGAKPWPLRPRPFPDELLSSWTARIAQAHGIEIKCFLSEIWPGQRNHESLLDVVFPFEVISILAKRAVLPLEQVHRMVVSELTNPTYKGNSKTIQERLDYVPKSFRKTLSHQIQICPDCLRDDPIPYFRRSWRLCAVTACGRHGRLLIEICPNCRRESHEFLPSWLRREGVRVSNKKTRSCSCLFEQTEKASMAAICLQERLLAALENKSFEVDAVESAVKLCPIDLHFLVKNLLFKHPGAVRFQDRLRSLLSGGPGREWSPTTKPHHGIENLPVRRRHAFMDAAAQALELGPLQTGMPIGKATLAGILRYRVGLERRKR